MPINIRPHGTADDRTLDGLAKAAFAEFQPDIPAKAWSGIYAEWCRMSELQEHGEIHVALDGEQVVGGVCYLGPESPKAQWFKPSAVTSKPANDGHRKTG